MRKTTQKKTADEVYAEFIRLAQAKNLAEETLAHYDRGYNLLKQFMQVNGVEYFTDFGQDDWLDLIGWLQNGKRKAVTINTYLRGMRPLFLFSRKKYNFPNVDFVFLKEMVDVRTAYAEEQILKLIREPLEHSFLATRGWAATCMLLYSALREKSILNMKVCDIDFSSGEIAIRHLKTNKPKILPLAGTMLRVFRLYLEERAAYLRQNRFSDPEWVFINRSGKKMTRDSFYAMQKRHNLSRGVAKTGLHVFRNTFAKMMIHNKCDIFTLQQWMCHREIKSTKRYIDLYTRDLHNTVNEYNPLEKLQQNVFLNKS